MSIKKVKPAYFLGANLNDPKVLGSKIDEIISAVNRLTHSASQEIDALIGGGQTGAAALIVGFNLVNTETTGDSVILPCLSALCTCEGPCASTDGCGCVGGLVYPVIIKNDGPGDLSIYPCLGDSINGGSPNAPIVLVSGGTIAITEVDCLAWESYAPTTPPAAGGISGFGMFYGLTAGTGNGGADDYPATVPTKTAAATGRVPFPRTGPLGTDITLGPVNPSSTPANNLDNFILATVGTYEVSFHVHTTERGQLQLELQGADLAETLVQDYNPTSGGHLISGTSYITTTVANSVLAVINPVGNATALTITQADGNLTHANAQSITIKFLG